MKAPGPARVRPVLVAAATALGVTLTTLLGLWQLDRGQRKEAYQRALDAQADRPELTTSGLLAAADTAALHHRKVRVAGQWLAGHTVYLDNRQMNGRPGFYVLTPLRLDGSERVLLVQRGWIARDFQDRQRLQPVHTPPTPVQISGRLAPPPSKLYALGDEVPGAIRQNLDLASFSRQTGLLLMGVSLLQTDEASDGLLRQWPQVQAGAPRHRAYAFQWFGLGAMMALLFIWFQIVRRTARFNPRS